MHSSHVHPRAPASPARCDRREHWQRLQEHLLACSPRATERLPKPPSRSAAARPLRLTRFSARTSAPLISGRGLLAIGAGRRSARHAEGRLAVESGSLGRLLPEQPGHRLALKHLDAAKRIKLSLAGSSRSRPTAQWIVPIPAAGHLHGLHQTAAAAASNEPAQEYYLLASWLAKLPSWMHPSPLLRRGLCSQGRPSPWLDAFLRLLRLAFAIPELSLVLAPSQRRLAWRTSYILAVQHISERTPVRCKCGRSRNCRGFGKNVQFGVLISCMETHL